MKTKKKSDMELLEDYGKVEHEGRRYLVQKERVVNTGDDYISIKLYNSSGRFIKRLAIDPEITSEIAALLLDAAPKLTYDMIARRWPHLIRPEVEEVTDEQEISILEEDDLPDNRHGIPGNTAAGKV